MKKSDENHRNITHFHTDSIAQVILSLFGMLKHLFTYFWGTFSKEILSENCTSGQHFAASSSLLLLNCTGRSQKRPVFKKFGRRVLTQIGGLVIFKYISDFRSYNWFTLNIRIKYYLKISKPSKYRQQPLFELLLKFIKII